jgi:glycosyltransferase involved in cell wall biosynthesis
MTSVRRKADSPANASLEPAEARLRIASFPPPIAQNPYQRLLYDGLAHEGIELHRGNSLKLGWLVRTRRSIQILHFHWPEGYYRHGDGVSALERILSWPRLALFAVRIAAAQALGYRIVWTLHQVSPHESSSRRLDRLGTRLLARASRLLVAHDEDTAARGRAAFSLPVAVVPHGSYVGVYPRRRPRAAVRRELGLAEDGVVFLSFGHLRAYKELDLLLAAFMATRESCPTAMLVVAGMPLDADSGPSLTQAAAADPRIRPLGHFVPDDEVADLFAAADVAVLPRGDGGTSGSLVLALSLGLPVIAAARPAYADMVEGGPGWLFTQGDAGSLRDALEDAAGASEEARGLRGAAASRRAEALRWDDSCRKLASLLRKTCA